jgi:hypothetical protein
LIVGIGLRRPLVAAALPALYAAVLVLFAASVVPRKGLAVAALVPLALATIHVAYALGLTYGFLAALVYPRAWDHAGSMSALSR